MTAPLLQLTSVTKSFGAMRALKGVSFDLRAGRNSATSLFEAISVALPFIFDGSHLTAAELRWERLPPIPATIGVAGSYAGVSDGALLVAGGANFPGRKPWEGGTKVWQDDVFVLETPAGPWMSAGKLPLPLGYGAALTHPLGLVCIGGSGPDRHSPNSFILRWSAEKLTTITLPDLPEPRANHCGGLLGDTAFIFGGASTPGASNAMNSLLSLNLTKPQSGWQTLEPLPGPGRIFATAGTQGGSLYVFGGAA